jgi:hypothetical protein
MSAQIIKLADRRRRRGNPELALLGASVVLLCALMLAGAMVASAWTEAISAKPE